MQRKKDLENIGRPPELSGSVCAYHPAAPGSNPKPNIYALLFPNCNVKRTKVKGIGPCFRKKIERTKDCETKIKDKSERDTDGKIEIGNKQSELDKSCLINNLIIFCQSNLCYGLSPYKSES